MRIETKSTIEAGKLASWDSMSGLVKVKLTGHHRPNTAGILECECIVTANRGPWKRGTRHWIYAHRLVPRCNVRARRFGTYIFPTAWTAL